MLWCVCSKLPLRSGLKTESASIENSTTASSSSSNVLANQAYTSEVILQTLVKLDSLGIIDPVETKTKLEIQKETLNHFQKSISVDFSGRYEVVLPWVLDNKLLSSNKKLAETRLQSTKRKLIATANHIFDPIGFTAPVTLKPKLILQEIWKLKLKWDENIPEVILNQVKQWLEQLPILADGDRFNSCQVIYSQFGLAIHQNDHQARRRFVEWAQNEIAVVPDFHKRILFSDEAHFWLNGYVNKQNCRIWSEANPQVYVETPLNPEKLTVWCALWAGGILL
ncbi:hypothetical protein TNCV_4863001 [Trichonephila clavipes]|nr:hypothetical protein TNCV_4863001 [Trichonephila clavipes]